MDIISKYYDVQKLNFYDLDTQDQIKVLTYTVGKEMPFIWKELDIHRDMSKQATARSIVLNEKGRNGRSAMPKYTENVLNTIPGEEKGEDIISTSLESLFLMLKQVIQEGNNLTKARKFMNTLESVQGAKVLFISQVIVSGELLIEQGHNIKNGVFLESRLRAKGKAKNKISALYRQFHNQVINLDQLFQSIESILSQFANEFLISMVGMEQAVDEKSLYELTEKRTIDAFISEKIEEIREAITGQKRLFIPE